MSDETLLSQADRKRIAEIVRKEIREALAESNTEIKSPSLLEVVSRYPDYPWYVALGGTMIDYKVVRAAPTADKEIVLWVERAN